LRCGAAIKLLFILVVHYKIGKTDQTIEVADDSEEYPVAPLFLTTPQTAVRADSNGRSTEMMRRGFTGVVIPDV
jgi:hypothetical protein